jgi:hypothetical protein
VLIDILGRWLITLVMKRLRVVLTPANGLFIANGTRGATGQRGLNRGSAREGEGVLPVRSRPSGDSLAYRTSMRA